MSKTIKVPLDREQNIFGGFWKDGEFFQLTYKQFVEKSGADLAVALFKGEFQAAVENVVAQAQARGEKLQFSKLLGGALQSELTEMQLDKKAKAE